ncbi:hypothetical protein K2173_024829 [Erythroxylum novogranatense]|uniref:Cation-transporting P-type ATPase N-terminal domain-containing protein n=1 Tax=Erythroxylum novogranatense TaxID=1862640 RepID=A0AAV8UDR3_9ROSI|nr:hypothetical protein K2173_024829 [Erythroxylum novogranatense]
MVVKSDGLDAVMKEAVDLEKVSIEEVFNHLKCTREGLSSDDVRERLALFGYNKLEEKKESKLLKFLGFMWNPLSWVMEAAAIMAIALANGGGKGPDYQDFVDCGLHCSKLRQRMIYNLQIASAISAIANWEFAGIRSIGWGWTGAIWVFNIVTYLLLDPLKFAVRYALSGRAWNLVVDQRTALTSKKDFGKEEREAAWAAEQRSLHGLQSGDYRRSTDNRSSVGEPNHMAEEARKRAEIARLTELHTLKGKVENAAKRRGLDVEAMNQHYTL